MVMTVWRTPKSGILTAQRTLKGGVFTELFEKPLFISCVREIKLTPPQATSIERSPVFLPTHMFLRYFNHCLTPAPGSRRTRKIDGRPRVEKLLHWTILLQRITAGKAPHGICFRGKSVDTKTLPRCVRISLLIKGLDQVCFNLITLPCC